MAMKYTYIEKFTLVPEEFYTAQVGKEALIQQFQLAEDVHVECCNPGHSGAVVVYPVGNVLEGETSERTVPFVVGMMDVARGVHEYNKVAFHYCKEVGFAHIVIYTGDELKLANSFKVDSFESALYFLFLSIKGLQMNPQQCMINICWNISDEQKKTVVKFFKGANVVDLDIDLIK